MKYSSRFAKLLIGNKTYEYKMNEKIIDLANQQGPSRSRFAHKRIAINGNKKKMVCVLIVCGMAYKYGWWHSFDGHKYKAKPWLVNIDQLLIVCILRIFYLGLIWNQKVCWLILCMDGFYHWIVWVCFRNRNNWISCNEINFVVCLAWMNDSVSCGYPWTFSKQVCCCRVRLSDVSIFFTI